MGGNETGGKRGGGFLLPGWAERLIEAACRKGIVAEVLNFESKGHGRGAFF